MIDYVISLDDRDAHRTEIAGGKGASLARMRATGVPVPQGFVVTAAALDESLERCGALDDVKRLAGSFVSGSDGVRVAGEVQDIMTGLTLWGDLASAISDAYAALDDDAFVAVRSSACAEDGEVASFAGQQETFLNVVGAPEVLDKIVECWASFFSERALFYRLSKGSLTDTGMAVVVQQQIGSDKSGVMFTTDPIRRRSDQMVIEATFGLGEALVSGLVTPDNYVVRRDGRLKKSRVGRQDQMIVRNSDGGTTTVDLDEEAAASRVLDDDEIRRLASLGLELEEAFGSPQDIEWAFESGELYVLQSRPITA